MKKEKKTDEAASLQSVIETLEKENAALKKSNAAIKAQVTSQRKEKERWKDYGIEADELNEKRIAEIDDLKTTLSLANKKIEEYDKTIKELQRENEKYKEKCEEFRSLPWYKRIYFK